jgi:RimJ/RimL family protein N-acetyltransferase
MMLAGTRVVLRDKGRDSDDEDLFRWLNLEEPHYYDQPDKPFTGITREEFDKRYEEQRRRPSSNSRGWHVDTTEGQHIGWVTYYNLDEQAKRAYVGIFLPEEETWGKGYGTEAMRLLVDHLFAEMELQEIRTATWTGNKRMMRCAEKSGFTEAARMPHRAEFSIRGEPLERIEFSISREDWSAQNEGGV